MSLPSWLVNFQTGFFVNMDKVAHIEIIKEKEGDQDKYHIRFNFDNSVPYTAFVPAGSYDTMKDAIAAAEKMMFDLNDRVKSLLVDAMVEAYKTVKEQKMT